MKNSLKNPKILASLCALALTAQAGAVVVVSTTRGGTGDQANMLSAAGQTFTTGSLAGETLLTTIELVGPTTIAVGDISNNYDGPFTVEIWTDTDGNATTWDPGILVASSDNTVTFGGGTVTYTMNFSSGNLADNTVYVMSFNNGTSSHASFRMGLTAPTTDGPLGTDGKLFHIAGNPSFGDNRELAFTVNTTIPEPSVSLLGLLAFAGCLRRRR